MNSAKNKKYQMVCKSSIRSKERNDCCVKALSMAGRVTYNVAHKICKENGRVDGKGMYDWQLHNSLRTMGFELETVENLVQKNGSRYTPKTIGSKLKTGYYIVYVNGHVLPVINGEVFDWTNNRKHRVNLAFKVVRKRSK